MKAIGTKRIFLVGFAAMLIFAITSALSVQAQADNYTDAMRAIAADDEPANLEAEALSNVSCDSGMAGDYPCSNVDLMAFMPFSALGGGNFEANDIWGWTDPLTGKEYALLGRTHATIFVDISDPMNPVLLGGLPGRGSPSTWRDVKVYDNHAFIVSEAFGHGMQVFDLTRLRDVTTPMSFTEDGHYDGFGNAHNIVINEDSGFAYGVGTNRCNGGLAMVDISTPTNPTNAGCFSADFYTHDAQCVIYNGPDLTYIGREICFNSNEDTLTIVDVTDKANPVQLARRDYANDGYTHQSWLTEDHTTVILDDETDELGQGHNTRTRIFDVSDLNSVPTPTIYESSVAAIDHNLYIKGHSVYQANYRAGLRILDASAARNGGGLTEIGFFDVYPSSNGASFNGAWSNYPYFDSEIVIVSHIEEGLFVLKPDLGGIADDFVLTPDEVVLDVCGNSDSLSFNVNAAYDYAGPTSFSVSGVPAGATGAFSPATLTTPDGNAILTISDTSAAQGSYLLEVTASGAGVTHTEYLRLNVLEVGAPACQAATAVDMLPGNVTNSAETLPIIALSIMLLTLMSAAILRRQR